MQHEGIWTFDKNLVLFKKFDGTQQVHQIQITKSLFWVRIHYLSHLARNKYIGHLIGSSLGKLSEVNLEKGELEWGEYMQVRICLDITKPLH